MKLAIRSIQAKFLAILVPLVLISTVIVFGLFELNARKNAEVQLHAKLAKMINIQKLVVADALWNVADDQIELMLAALRTDPDVVAVAINDETGLIASSGDIEQFDSLPFVERAEIVYDDGGEDVQSAKSGSP